MSTKNTRALRTCTKEFWICRNLYKRKTTKLHFHWGIIIGDFLGIYICRLSLMRNFQLSLSMSLWFGFIVTCINDILYLDATGQVVKKIKEFNRILYYCLSVRHPFGSFPLLPVAEYISSVHTADAIRSFLMYLRRKEKTYFQIMLTHLIFK